MGFYTNQTNTIDSSHDVFLGFYLIMNFCKCLIFRYLVFMDTNRKKFRVQCRKSESILGSPLVLNRKPFNYKARFNFGISLLFQPRFVILSIINIHGGLRKL